jgi:enhancing lycopene biosynthesis protein 2
MTKTILARLLLGAGVCLVASSAFAWGAPHAGGAAAPPRVGVLVYGAGMMDGSEVQEVVLTMLALERAGAQITYIAPGGDQAEVVDHQTNAVVTGAPRNMAVEAARITHGGVVALDQVEPEDLDALVLPGGLGFVKSVTTFGRDGMNMTWDPALGRLLEALHAQGKPIAFLCITPILAARLFGAEHPRLTVGTDPGMAALIEAVGARAVPATAEEAVVDEEARFVSSPAYMLGPSISHVAEGIGKAVARTLELAERRRRHH